MKKEPNVKTRVVYLTLEQADNVQAALDVMLEEAHQTEGQFAIRIEIADTWVDSGLDKDTEEVRKFLKASEYDLNGWLDDQTRERVGER